MDLSCIYNDSLLALCNAKNQIESKIYQKEIETLYSPEFEPKLVEWLKYNLNGALLYIPHVRSMGDRGDVLGIDEDGNQQVFWDFSYIRKIFPEQDRYEYLEDQDLSVWDVCQISIQLIEGHYVHLSYDDEVQESYNYSVEYCVQSKYNFMANVLENILLKYREEIWEKFYENP